jgi:ATP-dependent RNA helicase DeaD
MSPQNGNRTFTQWPLKREILDALAGMGFTTPTDIQQEAIPLGLQGEDVVGQAKTGTGKTAAFGIPMIQHLHLNEKHVQGLVLCPTRELAEQVCEQLGKIGKDLGVRAAAIYGGTKFESQIRDLRRGAHIVVGTPGRVMDLMRRGILDVSKVECLVLDEADRMLDMGFIEDIQWILSRVPPKDRRQTLFFSATMPDAVRELVHRFMRHPNFVKGVTTDALTVETVRQEYFSVGRRNKLWALDRVLRSEEWGLMVVFCATKRMADRLAHELKDLGYQAAPLHGDLTQAKRQRVLDRFRAGEVNILVATDVAARGLDIENVTHVVNYDLPEDPEQYVHRVGRTARMGRAGKAISFVSKHDKRQLELVQMLAGGLIELREPPEPPTEGSGKDRVKKVIDWDHISDRYGNVHFRIEIGRSHGATLTALHKMIRGAAGVQDYLIGPIKIREEDSTFTMPKDYAMRTLQGLRRVSFNGKKFHAEIVPQA